MATAMPRRRSNQCEMSATSGAKVAAELKPISTWTADGHVIGQPDGERALRRCSVDGACEDREVPGLDEDEPLLVVADYLMVG